MTLAEVAAAQTVPLPRPRPFSNTEAPPHAPRPAVARRRRRPAGIRLTAERAIAPSVDAIEGPGECGGIDLVRLEAVMLPDNSRVEINPPAVLRCSMAEAIVDWVRDDLAQLRRSISDRGCARCGTTPPITAAAATTSSAPMISEHGKGNALDVRSITLVNGKTIDPTDPHVSQEFREGWKKSVCARFSTVLGPGSDGYHENHIHVDLMQRRNGYRAMCQWDVRMPEAKPAPELASASIGAAAAAASEDRLCRPTRK